MDKNVFVIMPFTNDCFEMYELLKIKLGEYFNFSNAADEDNQQNILKDIVLPIYNADVIIADLSGQNSNVMYELGVAHSLGKKTIVITRDDLSTLPFDLKVYRVKKYDMTYKMFDDLIEYLKRNISGAIDGGVLFGNPISDILMENGIDKISIESQESGLIIEEGEKGFVDFLAEIESNTDNFTNTLNEMVSDMNHMSEGINECTSEIERVNTIGGSGTASFVRKQTKKAAKYIDEFGKKIKNHNSKLEIAWDKIESNSIGLLDNQFSKKDENRDSLKKYLESLRSMKVNAKDSLKSMESLKGKLDDLMGLQRTMTQSIKFLKQDLDNYISFIDKLTKSVDYIIIKSGYTFDD